MQRPEETVYHLLLQLSGSFPSDRSFTDAEVHQATETSLSPYPGVTGAYATPSFHWGSGGQMGLLLTYRALSHIPSPSFYI